MDTLSPGVKRGCGIWRGLFYLKLKKLFHNKYSTQTSFCIIRGEHGVSEVSKDWESYGLRSSCWKQPCVLCLRCTLGAVPTGKLSQYTLNDLGCSNTFYQQEKTAEATLAPLNLSPSQKCGSTITPCLLQLFPRDHCYMVRRPPHRHQD